MGSSPPVYSTIRGPSRSRSARRESDWYWSRRRWPTPRTPGPATGPAEELAEHDHRRQCCRRRFETHQDAEDPRRDPAQCDELEAVRDDRAEQADRQPERSTSGWSSRLPAARIAGARECDRADHAGDGEPLEARPATAGLGAHHDVAGPRRVPRAARTATPATFSEPGDRPRSATPDAGQQDPDQVEQPTGTRSTATVRGPRNSMVTATPSGIRAKDW